jgi:hypothetical protein
MRDWIADCGLRICVLPAQSGPEEKKRYQWRILVLSGFGDFLHSWPLKRSKGILFLILNFFLFSSFGMGKLGKLGADRKLAFASRRWRFLTFGFFYWFEGRNYICIVQVPWLSSADNDSLFICI